MTYQEWYQKTESLGWYTRFANILRPLSVSWRGEVTDEETTKAVVSALDHGGVEYKVAAVSDYYGAPLVVTNSDWQYCRFTFDDGKVVSGGQLWKLLVEAARAIDPEGDPVGSALAGKVRDKLLRFGPDGPDDDTAPDVVTVSISIPAPTPEDAPADTVAETIAAMQSEITSIKAALSQFMDYVEARLAK